MNGAAEVARAVGTNDALELRASGLGYSQIAERLGVPRSTAYDRIQAALAELPRENAETVLDLELARLDRSHARLEPKAERGNPRAIEAQLRISARRSKLLGLDAAIKLDLGTDIPTDPRELKLRLLELLRREEEAGNLACMSPREQAEQEREFARRAIARAEALEAEAAGQEVKP